MRRVVAGVLALAFVCAAAGCGGTSRRTQVSNYFKKVDQIQRDMRKQIVLANQAYHLFPTASTSASERTRLAKAELTIKKLRSRVGALAAPKDALRVRHDFLLLLDRQVAFAHDVVLLGAYTPKLSSVLADAGKAGAKLQANLKSTSAATQATAFRAYAAALDRDSKRLRTLSPPAVVLAAHVSQLHTLTKSAALCRRIAAALDAHDRTSLGPLVQQLTNLSSLPARKRVHHAQVIAVKAFNNRLISMNRLSARIQRERAALERKL